MTDSGKPGHSQVAEAFKVLANVEIRSAHSFAMVKAFNLLKEALELLQTDCQEVKSEPIDPSSELPVGTEPTND